MTIEIFPACLHESERPLPDDILDTELTQLVFAAKALTDVLDAVSHGIGGGANWELAGYEGELQTDSMLQVVRVSDRGMTATGARMLGAYMMDGWEKVRGLFLPEDTPASPDGVIRHDNSTRNRMPDFADRLLMLDGTPYKPGTP